MCLALTFSLYYNLLYIFIFIFFTHTFTCIYVYIYNEVRFFFLKLKISEITGQIGCTFQGSLIYVFGGEGLVNYKFIYTYVHRKLLETKAEFYRLY